MSKSRGTCAHPRCLGALTTTAETLTVLMISTQTWEDQFSVLCLHLY